MVLRFIALGLRRLFFIFIINELRFYFYAKQMLYLYCGYFFDKQ